MVTLYPTYTHDIFGSQIWAWRENLPEVEGSLSHGDEIITSEEPLSYTGEPRFWIARFPRIHFRGEELPRCEDSVPSKYVKTKVDPSTGDLVQIFNEVEFDYWYVPGQDEVVVEHPTLQTRKLLRFLWENRSSGKAFSWRDLQEELGFEFMHLREVFGRPQNGYSKAKDLIIEKVGGGRGTKFRLATGVSPMSSTAEYANKR